MVLEGLSKEIWEKKYRAEGDADIEATWRRVASFIASAEDRYDGPRKVGNAGFWAQRFFELLSDFTFIPGGRITEGSGTKNPYLNNCFVLDIEDNLDNIYETVKRVAIISKKNGGVGFNPSKLRPAGATLSGGGTGSGVVSFLKVFDASCEVIKTGSKNRRAALISILDISHPEIFDYIDAKRQPGVLQNFNLSVSIPDAFMKAVQQNGDWDLVHSGKVYRTVKAKDLWEKLCYSAWMFNDPGIFFYDTVNNTNNGWYQYDIRATNPCGELGLPSWAACCLGNINLTKFIKEPFSGKPLDENFDLVAYKQTVRTAVRFLDNVLDVSLYPYEQNKEIAQGDRRLGLNGLAGLGSALAMLQLPYDSEGALDFAEVIQQTCAEEAYYASTDLAIEKGKFPNYDDKILESGFIKRLSGGLRHKIEDYGLRNIAILTIPPVGTGSLLAGNISNGLEPIFALEYDRRILRPDGTHDVEPVEDYAWKLYKKDVIRSQNYFSDNIPGFFKTSRDIDPKAHVDMQSIIQQFVDGSISKTINMPESYTLDEYEYLLQYAWKSGLKGVTSFREGTREGVLVAKGEGKKEEPKATGDCPEPLKRTRPRKLNGATFQIPDKDNGKHTYVTINSFEENGEHKPWEIFIDAKGSNSDLYAAVGLLASRLMRKTDDVQGVIDELKSVQDTKGYFTQEYGYVESKPQHIGYILEEFVNELNPQKDTSRKYTECPECGAESYTKEGGCGKCLDCGYSACG